MSKLDDVLRGDTLGIHDQVELKQQIKDLFTELVDGYSQYYPGNEGLQRTLEALTKRIEEL